MGELPRPDHSPRHGVWNLRLPRGRTLTVGPIPLIAGVLNCTPDSFSDGGRYGTPDLALEGASAMIEDGADWIDVGGESTRPGADPVAPRAQIDRIVPVIRGLRDLTEAAISVDTMSPEVGRAALDAGADIVNDVSACRDPGWLDLLRERDVPIVLAHMRGSPRDMQAAPEYPSGVVPEVVEFFARRIGELEEAGIDPARILVDPGIGFGKRLNDNWDLVRNIEAFRALGRPVFLGTSRKSFLRRTIESASGNRCVEELLDVATTAVNGMALLGGVDVLRVHNVAYARVLVRLYGAFQGPAPAS